jgi:exopolyphosphatase/guanosine-5'-triphosphate,3'-diphosphate pyrophosphatase
MPSLPSLAELQRRFDPDPRHSEQVTRLSLQLFDELGELHQLPHRARQLLQAAALLHDIGYALDNGSAHHKNSLNLILKHGLESFTPREIQMIANIARYHRRSMPTTRHESYRQLTEAERLVVDKLASLLRLADGFDHSHRSSIHSLHAQIRTDYVEIILKYLGELKDEISSANRKADLFRRTFNLDLVFAPYPLFEKPVTKASE